MALIVAGVSHVTAPIEVREKLALRPQEALRELARLRELGLIREGVVLSTCNRTEVYAIENGRDLLPEIAALLSNRLGSDASEFVYVRRDRDAAVHLFGVTAGLHSMILGEAQIHGQVKDAWEQCRSESGPVLNRMFQTALLAASRAREETGIGRGAASVSSAAVQLAKKIFGNLAPRDGRRFSPRSFSTTPSRQGMLRSSRWSVCRMKVSASRLSPTALTSERRRWRSGTPLSRCTTINAGNRCATST